MNTLKPMLIFAVLIGVCYGVYTRINHKPSAPPPEAMVNWENTEPQVQIPGAGGPGESKSPGPLGNSFVAGAIPGGGGAPPANNSGGNFPPTAAFTLGPGTAPPSADSAPPLADAGQGAWTPAADGSAAPGGYDTLPGGVSTGPPGQAGAAMPAQGYESYGVPPAYGQGAPGGAGQDPAGYGQMPVGANPGGIDPAGRGVDGFPVGGDPAHATGATTPFTAAVDQARHELDAGRLPEAHYQLSRWYDDPNLTPQEQQQLTDLLDQLAGTVIYSTQNLMEPACEVQPGETLERIAQRYNVPWQLLAKINGIDDPHTLRPGERLKVVRGPFSAVVNLEKHTLTLMLGSAYAGRFAIGVGQDFPAAEGQYFVNDKVVDPIYYGPGRTIDHGDPANPLGRRWLGLGGQIGIHGTNDPRNVGQNGVPGSICLSDRDADDVFDILSEGSKVVIRR